MQNVEGVYKYIYININGYICVCVCVCRLKDVQILGVKRDSYDE